VFGVIGYLRFGCGVIVCKMRVRSCFFFFWREILEIVWNSVLEEIFGGQKYLSYGKTISEHVFRIKFLEHGTSKEIPKFKLNFQK